MNQRRTISEIWKDDGTVEPAERGFRSVLLPFAEIDLSKPKISDYRHKRPGARYYLAEAEGRQVAVYVFLRRKG